MQQSQTPSLPKLSTNKLQQQIYQKSNEILPINTLNKQDDIILSIEEMNKLKNYQLYPRNEKLKYLFTETILNNQSNVIKFLERYQPYKQKLIKEHKKKFQIVKFGINKYYIGEIFNGKAHGVGIMIFDDGRLYQGQLENNFRQGEGLSVEVDRSWYYGQYSNGKKDGYGLEVTKSYTYKGKYVNGLKHGKGQMIAKNLIFNGEWRMGKINGFGILENQISRYQGNFSNFLKHGSGYQKFKNGDTYRGHYLNGKPEGQGQYKWYQEQCIFNGFFKQGQRCGRGIWENKIGDKYIGNYKNDLKQGYGEFYWKSGNIYKGNFQHDKRNGYGEMYWNDGGIYKGQWQNGVQNGRGELCLPNMQIIRGLFQKNVYVGNPQTPLKSKNASMGQIQPITQKINLTNLPRHNAQSVMMTEIVKKQYSSTNVNTSRNQQYLIPNRSRIKNIFQDLGIDSKNKRNQMYNLNIVKKKDKNRYVQYNKVSQRQKASNIYGNIYSYGQIRRKKVTKGNVKDNITNLLRFKF